MDEWQASDIILSSSGYMPPLWDADEIVLTPLWDGDGVLFEKFNEFHDELGRFGSGGGASGFSEYRATAVSGRKGSYDPRYFTLQEDKLVADDGEVLGVRDNLIPKDPRGWDAFRIPASKDPNVIFRGMSAGEYNQFAESGELKSKGSYNIGSQQAGLTYFSTDPESAAHYASGFAPKEFKATPDRPAYVVAIKRPGPGDIVRVMGTGEDEVGVSRAVQASDVVGVYRGRVIESDGAGQSTLAWKKVGFDKYNPFHDELGHFATGDSGGMAATIESGFEFEGGGGILPEMPPDGPIVYHGTSTAMLDSILKDGLVAEKGKGADEFMIQNLDPSFKEDRAPSVYFAGSPINAEMYAHYASKATGSEAVVIPIRLTKSQAEQLVWDEHGGGGGEMRLPTGFTIPPSQIGTPRIGKPAISALSQTVMSEGVKNSKWFSPHVFDPKAKQRPIKLLGHPRAHGAQLVMGKADEDADHVIFAVILVDPKPAKKFNEDQPRDEQGRWTALGGSEGHYALISTAPITAIGVGAAGRAAMAHARTQYTRIDMAQLDKDPVTKATMVQLFRDPELFPMIRADEWTGNTDQDARLIIDRMKSNLTAMWNDIPDAQRQEWRSWYDGAHNLIGNRMEEYKDFNIDRASMTGVYAALSPNTMWDVNVHLGDRLLDTYFHHGDDMWDAGMQKAADEQIARAERGIAAKEEKTGIEATQARLNLEVIKEQYADLEDKTLNQLDGDSVKEAAWIKLYNDAHDNTGVREVKINGEMGEPIRNKAKLGEEGEELSGSFGVANRAIAALDALKSGGDANKLSEAVGDRHKVRSFYNNMLDPNSPNDDVTIDTHAGGAAWLMPLGGKDTQIGQMLGSSVGKGKPGAPTSRVTGIKGTYPFYADAYREVAREVGLAHPRELQSIEWEKKIELFKNFPDAKRVQVDEAWKMFYDGAISLEQAQSNVLRIAKEGSRK